MSAGARIAKPGGVAAPLMLYVNVPFCRSKCSFCDHVQPIPVNDLLLSARDGARRRYVEALCTEIAARGRELSPHYVPEVVYWGGGTASILEPHEIAAVSGALESSFDLSAVQEATIECSPDTADRGKLELFRRRGFNRMSSGVQSFDDQRLRSLGRRHTARGARDVVRHARDAGFDNINIDIMCGFPDETTDEVDRTVSAALELGVEHISLYPFRPTPGTALRAMIDRDRVDLHLVNQKISFLRARAAIVASGYTEYASGYFGRPSRFALDYFQLRTPLLGLGSGAMSLVEQRFRSHLKGALHHYSADPLRYDVDVDAGSDPVVLASLRAGISCFDGIVRREWANATGTELDEVLCRPVLGPLVEFLRRRGLQEDERGMRLPPERVGTTLIDLAFHVIGAAEPASAGDRIAAELEAVS